MGLLSRKCTTCGLIHADIDLPTPRPVVPISTRVTRSQTRSLGNCDQENMSSQSSIVNRSPVNKGKRNCLPGKMECGDCGRIHDTKHYNKSDDTASSPRQEQSSQASKEDFFGNLLGLDKITVPQKALCARNKIQMQSRGTQTDKCLPISRPELYLCPAFFKPPPLISSILNVSNKKEVPILNRRVNNKKHDQKQLLRAFNFEALDKESLLNARYLTKNIGCDLNVDLRLGEGGDGHIDVFGNYKIGLFCKANGTIANGKTFMVHREVKDLSKIPNRFWQNVRKLWITGHQDNGDNIITMSALEQIALEETNVCEIHGKNLNLKENQALQKIILKNINNLDILELMNTHWPDKSEGSFDCDQLREAYNLKSLVLTNVPAKGFRHVLPNLQVLKINSPLSVKEVEEIWSNYSVKLAVLNLEIDERMGFSRFKNFKDVTGHMTPFSKKSGLIIPGESFPHDLLQKMVASSNMKELMLGFKIHFCDRKSYSSNIPNFQYEPIKKRLHGWKTELEESPPENVQLEVTLEEEERIVPPRPRKWAFLPSFNKNKGADRTLLILGIKKLPA